MTDGPTNRIGRPSPGRPGSDDALTQRAYQQGAAAAPPTSRIDPADSNEQTQLSAQAWSQDQGGSGYYRESSDYYPEAPQANYLQSDAGDLAPKAWFRSAPTYLLAIAAVAVLTAGGGLAYTLTSSDHPAPAHPAVQPAPQQQNNDASPAPQAPPPAQDQPPAPAPDAPVSAPDNSSGSAPNFAPAPEPVQAPVVQVPVPQQQPPDPIQQAPENQPDPNQQFPNNQGPNNGQFPGNQQHPGHHHPPNNPENQNGNGNAPQNQNQNGNGNAPQNQNQNGGAPQNQNGNGNGGQKQNSQNQPAQKQESPNDTLCHPKPPPC